MKPSSLCVLGLLPLAFLFLTSCSKDIQNQEAVRQGVLDYLQQRSKEIGIDMSAMDVKVTSVSFEKDSARAGIAFVPKGLPANAGMSMDYVLDRKGDKWVVRGRQSEPTSPHGGALPGGGAAPQQMPPGHPGVDGAAGGQMPPGHPGVGQGPAGQMPPGHPPVGQKQ